MSTLNHAQFYQLTAIYPQNLEENVIDGYAPIRLGSILIEHPSGRNYLLDTAGYVCGPTKAVGWFESLEETKEIQHKEFDYNITAEDILSGDVHVEVYTGGDDGLIHPESITLDVVINGWLHSLDAKSHLNNVDYFKTINVTELDDDGNEIAIHPWTISKVLEYINADRSEEWTDYDETDWVDGWTEWCNGECYRIAQPDLTSTYFNKR